MGRAIPVIIIVGLALYTFFDALNTPEGRFKRFSRSTWLLLAFIPVVGAALWFLMGRPAKRKDSYGPPRTLRLRPQSRQMAPDDDVSFLRKLDQDVWQQKRREQRDRKDTGSAPSPSAPPPVAPTGNPTPPTGTSGPADTGSSDAGSAEREPDTKKDSPDEEDL